MEAPERMCRRSSRSVSRAYVEEGELNPRKLLRVLQGLRDGDFSVRLPSDMSGLAGKVADVVNDIAAANQRFAREIERAGQLVGKDAGRDIAFQPKDAQVPGARWSPRSIR